MEEGVKYQGRSVDVAMVKKDVVIYPRPFDTIRLSFDASKLKSEAINGDLVVYLSNGKKVTIANYSLMFANEGVAPIILDILGKRYTQDDMFRNTKAYLTEDNLSPYVLDRKLSSADTNIQGQNYLAHTKEKQLSESDIKKFIGYFETSEQSPVSNTEIQVNPYQIRTQTQPFKMRNQVNEQFTYTGRTIKNSDEDDSLPTIVITTRINIEPLYGSRYAIDNRSTENRDLALKFDNGGGNKSAFLGYDDIGGLPSVEYQYLREKFDFSSSASSIQYNGNNNDIIHRKIKIETRSNSVSIQGITLSGIPEGVSIVSTDQYVVRSAGAVSVLEVRAPVRTIELLISYSSQLQPKAGLIEVFVTAYNFRINALVNSEDFMIWDFKKVNSVEDIENYNSINTFTFSTGIDKTEVTLTNSSDYIFGGKGDHNFIALDGNDVFVSGSGNESVNLGNDNDEYQVGLGQDTADGGGGILDVIKVFVMENSNNRVVPNDASIIVGDGNINISFATHSTIGKNFEYLELNDAANTVLVNNTNNLSNSLYIVGNGVGVIEGAFDTLNLGASTDIYVAESRLTTNGGASSVYYDVSDLLGTYSKIVDFIKGGAGNDNVFADTARTINFDGGAGFDAVWYNNISTGGIIYNQTGTGLVTNKGIGQDSYSNIDKIVGSSGADTFYGGFGVAVNAMEYWGYNTIDISTNIVTYDNSLSGITIDYTLSNPYISVFRNNRTVEDKLFYISNVLASQRDDTFIMDGSIARTLDGKQGRDTIDYSSISNTVIIFNIDTGSRSFSGRVSKGTTDNFTDIERFIGGRSALGNIFNIRANDYLGGGSFFGTSNSLSDTINYSFATNIAVEINVATGRTIIRDSLGTIKGEDEIINVENYILTNENDTIILTSIGNFSNITNVDAIIENNFSFGDINSRGDTLFLNTTTGIVATDDIIAAAFGKLANFESLALSNNNNVFFYNTAFANSFRHIYGGNLSDSLLMTAYVGNISYDVLGPSILVVLDIGTRFYLFNFEGLFGGIASDNFNVLANSAVNYNFQGGSGTNVLNYSGVVNNITTMTLLFDLANQRIIKDGNATSFDTFSEIQRFVGGSADDVFLLDPNRAAQIDGSDGVDTVSFINYVIAITNFDISSFTSIEVFELTRFNDVVSIFYDNRSESVSVIGGDGTDSYIVAEITAGLTYDIGVNDPRGPFVRATRGGGVDTLRSMEILRGGTFNDSFNMLLNTNFMGLTSNGRLYILDNSTTDNDEVNYSALTAFVVATIGGTDGTNNLLYMKVDKGPLSMDLMTGIEKVVLTNLNDKIVLNLLFNNARMIEVDAGLGQDTIDLSTSFGTYTVVIDTGSFEVNSVLYNITGWERVVGGFSGDTFIFSSLGQNYEVDGLGASDTVDVSRLNTNMSLNLVNRTLSNGTNAISLLNVEDFRFNATQVINITAILANSSIFSAVGTHTSNGSRIDYSNIVSDYGIAFVIGSNNTGQIIKDPRIGSVDYILNDFIDEYVATSKADIFRIGAVSRSITIDGNLGNDTLEIALAPTLTTGIIYNLTTSTARLTDTAGNLIISLRSIETMVGSVRGDEFRINNNYINIFDEKGSINGSSGIDLLNFNDATTPMTSSLYFDVASSIMYIAINKQPQLNRYIIISNFEDIRFGAGDDVIVVTTVPSSTIRTLDGGGGNNYFSYENSSVGLRITLGTLPIGAGNITIISFTNYIMTRFDDVISTPVGTNFLQSVNVDGNLGIDTINYSPTTDVGVTLDFIQGQAEVVATRGTQTDRLLNIEIYNLSQQNSTVNMGTISNGYTLNGFTGRNNTLDYHTLVGSILIEFGRDGVSNTNLVVYKRDATNNLISIDNAANFNVFYGTTGQDLLILSRGYDTSRVTTIDLGQAGTMADSITAISSASDVLYVETATGADITMTSGTETKSYSILGGTNLNIQDITGSRTNRNTFVSNFQSNTAYFGSKINTNDELRYTSLTGTALVTANLTFDVLLGTVSNGTKTIRFYDVDILGGGGGNDSFINLNDYTAYRINGFGISGGRNLVSYDRAINGIIIALSSTGVVSVTKQGGILNDNIQNVTHYRGTGVGDRFDINISASGISDYIFDGGVGSDIINFLGFSGAITVVYDYDGVSSVNGTTIAFINFENFLLTANDDTFTIVNSPNINGIIDVNAGNGRDTFNLTNSGVFTRNADVNAVNMEVLLQDQLYSISLHNFEVFNFSNTAINLFNNDFNVSRSSYSFSGITSVTFYNFSNLTDLNLWGPSMVTNNTGTSPVFTAPAGITARYNFFTTSTPSTVILVRILSSNTVNYNIEFGPEATINVIMNHFTTANSNGAFLSAFGNRTLFADKQGAGTRILAKDFNNATLDISGSGSVGTFSIGTAANPNGVNIFKTIAGTTGIKISFANYAGAISTVVFENNTVTARVNNANNSTTFTDIPSFALTSNNDNVDFRQYSINNTEIDGAAGDDRLNWTRGLGVSSPQTSSITIASDGRVTGTVNGIRFINFEGLDFSGINSDFDRARKGITIIFGPSNIFNFVNAPTAREDIIGPNGTTHNVLDFSNAAFSNVLLTLFFETSGNTVTNRLFRGSGAYSTSSSVVSVIGFNNFKQAIGSPGNDVFKFGPLTLLQFTDLANKLVSGTLNTVPENSFYTSYLYFTGGGGIDEIDISSWIVFEDYDINPPIPGPSRPYGSYSNVLVGRDNASTWAIGATGDFATLIAYKPFLFVDSSMETLVLPQGVVYIEDIVDNTYTLVASRSLDKHSYVIFSGYTTRMLENNSYYSTNAIRLFEGPQGISTFTRTGSVAVHTLIGVEAISLSQMPEAVSIGGGAGGGVFLSSKVRLTMDSYFTEYVMNNTVPQVGDSVNFSAITSGNYYFTYETWDNPRDHFLGLGSPNASGRSVSLVYTAKYTAINSSNTVGANNYFAYSMGAGIAFTNYGERNLIEGNNRVDRMSVFYGIQGVDWITLTGANDVFSMGKAYYSPNNSYAWVMPYLVSVASPRTANLLEPGYTRVNGAGGRNTYLDQAITADFYRDLGVRQEVHVDWWITFTGSDAINTRVANATAPSSRTSLIGGKSITDLYLPINLEGFQDLDINDYGTDTDNPSNYVTMSNFRSRAYRGKDDDVFITHTSSLTLRSLQVDLGGRYITDNNTTGYDFGTVPIWNWEDPLNPSTNVSTASGYHVQTATIDFSGLTSTSSPGITMSWLFETNPLVDSSVSVRANVGIASYIIKNFDTLDFNGDVGSTLTLNFRNNFNFDVLDGKMFKIGQLPAGNTYNFYTGYNYVISQEADQRIVRVIEAASTRSFKLWLEGAGALTPRARSVDDLSTVDNYNYTAFNSQDNWVYGNQSNEAPKASNSEVVFASFKNSKIAEPNTLNALNNDANNDVNNSNANNNANNSFKDKASRFSKEEEANLNANKKPNNEEEASYNKETIRTTEEDENFKEAKLDLSEESVLEVLNIEALNKTIEEANKKEASIEATSNGVVIDDNLVDFNILNLAFSNNEGLDETQEVQVQSIKDMANINEDSIINTNNIDEASSMSFALEDSMNVSDDNSNLVLIDANKNKNNNGFGV